MGKNSTQDAQQEIVKSVAADPIKTYDDLGNDMYKIIGIVDNHYIVKTHKELKKVKIDMKNKVNINDEIRKNYSLKLHCYLNHKSRFDPSLSRRSYLQFSVQSSEPIRRDVE